jgi:beta-galactosidase
MRTLARAALAAAVSAVATAPLGAADWPAAGERRVSFDRGWRFAKGDPADAAAPGFADTTWRTLDLPHDWAIEGPFDPKINPHQGSLPAFGTAWYRKRFAVPATARGRRYSIELDGVMANARVFLNGHELGGRPYGYVGFALDLTPRLVFGGENVVAVRVAPEPESSRWYAGAGIYRHVWIDATGPVRVAHWGTYVTTPRVTDAAATVRVRTELQNHGPAASTVSLETTIVDAAGREVARASARPSVGGGATQTVPVELTVERPVRWDLDRPYRYTAVILVKRAGATLDRYETPFGIRTIEYGPEKGFLLNGRRVRFQGVCNHHDLGALGSAVNARAVFRQLEILKRMGANAVRTSHNPPAPELLDAADRLGFLVMDEAFDMWGKKKIENGHGKYFAEWAERDLVDMIRRDRNHPSVVMWSIGNEILEQADEDGAKTAKWLTEICHREDPTRPTTAGFNQVWNAIRNGLADQVDIPGFNYGAPEYARILAEHPSWTILGAETASTVSSRGVYHLPIEKYEKHPSHQITSYDVVAPPWAYSPDVEFEALDASPRVLGEFVWTGFDYIGEPTPFYPWDKPREEADWPARSSYFGIVDLAGFPKDRFYLYQSRWTTTPMVHVLPHWSWPGREGQPIPVMAYSNAEEVELFLDGRPLGRKRVGAEPVELPAGRKAAETGRIRSKHRLLWRVPYAPGTLKAVAYSGGREVASHVVRTAGRPARVVVAPDRARIRADGDDLSFVTVRIEDANGTLVPDAENLVRFAVTGAGRIAAVDNGSAASLESFQADHRKAFSGMALLIVRSKAGEKGTIQVKAAAEGLAAASVTLAAE